MPFNSDNSSPVNRIVIPGMVDLLSLYAEAGACRRAEALLHHILAAPATGQESNPTIKAQTLNNLATVYHATGRFRQAEAGCRDAVAVLQNASSGDRPEMAIILTKFRDAPGV